MPAYCSTVAAQGQNCAMGDREAISPGERTWGKWKSQAVACLTQLATALPVPWQVCLAHAACVGAGFLGEAFARQLCKTGCRLRSGPMCASHGKERAYVGPICTVRKANMFLTVKCCFGWGLL